MSKFVGVAMKIVGVTMSLMDVDEMGYGGEVEVKRMIKRGLALIP